MKKILPLALLLIIIFSGCTKRKESFLIGKWEDVPRIVNPSSRNVWTFQDGSDFSVESFQISNDSLVARVTGEYNLYKKNGQFNLKLNATSGAISYYTVSGVFWVEEVNRDFLKIVREKHLPDTLAGNPFVRYEMIKL